MDQKPQVLPTREQQQQRIAAMQAAEQAKVAAYEAEKAMVANDIYNSIQQTENVTPERMDAVEMMRRRTEEQMNQMKTQGQVVDPRFAEEDNAPTRVVQDQSNARNQEQMRLRDEQLKKNQEQIRMYQMQANQAVDRHNPNNIDLYQPNMGQQNNQMNQPQYNAGNQYQQNTYQGNTQGNFGQQNTYQGNTGQQNSYTPPVPPVPPSKPPVNPGYGDNYGKNPSNVDPYILELSQPNYNSPFDVIPLPSEGKLYRSKKPNIRLSYMTTADENILTSPNLLESGEFLEILINRKMLEPDLRYKDLHVGDRNAIMLWLRATGYGEMYPVTLLDEKDVPFDTDINLNNLATKNLGVEPDENGHFDYTFKLCKAQIKFKLLTCGDIDAIDRLVALDKKNNLPINKTNTYTMEHTIVSVNGDTSKSTIREFSNAIRIGDAKAFNEYIELIESGIDLNIDVRTPGGGSVKTFLPLNINFFWPNVKL
jgi:hypothetical protein